MILNYGQIENFAAAISRFHDLSDVELVSMLSVLPTDWREYVMNSKIATAIKNDDKEAMKDLSDRCNILSSQLGFQIGEKIKDVLDNNNNFYVDNVLYLQGAMEILNKYVDDKDIPENIFDGIHPKTIEYLKEIALGKEQYEVLQILKDKNL